MGTTIHVYLTDKGVEALRPLTDRHDIFIDKSLEGSRLILRGINASIPEILVGHVKKVTLWTSFPSHPERERGVYQSEDGSAEGELEIVRESGMDPWGGLVEYALDIQGKSLESVLALCADIKKGNAVPLESYAVKQSASLADDEREELEDLKRQMAYKITGPAGYPSLLKVLRDKSIGWWPFCRRSIVLRRVDAILANQIFD